MSNLGLCYVTQDLLFCSSLQLDETPYTDTRICIQWVLCEVPDTCCGQDLVFCGLLHAKDQIPLFTL